MNIRTNIKSGQSTIVSNTNAKITESANVSVTGGIVNVAESLNVAVIAQTNVAASVSTGGVSVGVSINVHA